MKAFGFVREINRVMLLLILLLGGSCTAIDGTQAILPSGLPSGPRAAFTGTPAPCPAGLYDTTCYTPDAYERSILVSAVGGLWDLYIVNQVTDLECGDVISTLNHAIANYQFVVYDSEDYTGYSSWAGWHDGTIAINLNYMNTFDLEYTLLHEPRHGWSSHLGGYFNDEYAFADRCRYNTA